jgi:hypothetical protein
MVSIFLQEMGAERKNAPREEVEAPEANVIECDVEWAYCAQMLRYRALKAFAFGPTPEIRRRELGRRAQTSTAPGMERRPSPPHVSMARRLPSFAP